MKNDRLPFEYINDFLYSVIKPDETRGDSTFLFCSGVNISRFIPLTSGKHGQASNPAFRGLQLTNHEVTALARNNGADVKILKAGDCSGLSPTSQAWSTESLLLQNISESFAGQLVIFSVTTLLKKIMSVCLPDIEPPKEFLPPKELQSFIESLCEQHGSHRETRNKSEVGILKKNYIKYCLDGRYRILCSNCSANNEITPDSTHGTCANCSNEIIIHRYPLAITPIRGNSVTSAVVKDNEGMRVVCGSCGLTIYVKCEGEESVTCIECGIEIEYNSYVT